ncbi:DUF6887 family protein [Scytonema hofmannii]|uniref:DUF6887 family protein n=1 Tax=Scytonema hofmannii TaxID=34078 RepID=UPI0003483922|nr:hypothetical protein [Scytonema hofmannii]
MKPNFHEMSRSELKAYVLAHRDDDEAIRVLFSRRNPSDSQAKWYPPLCTPEGVPIEENLRIAEEAMRKRAELDYEKRRQREIQEEQQLKARLRQEIETELEEKIRQEIEKEIEEKIRRKIEQGH